VSIAQKIGCVPQTLFEWVKKTEVDSGKRAGVPTEMADRLKALERENRELRQANEILRKASAYFDGVDGLTSASHSYSPGEFLSDKEDRHEELYSDRCRSRQELLPSACAARRRSACAAAKAQSCQIS
jgi:hypothetical protein